MNSNLESFRPKLRSGRVIPQGSRIIFETDNPYNQIVLPMALADMILLCSGHFSVREIVDKVYKKQGAVPFKSMLTAIHLLHQGGFFENGDQLVLSSHLQSWMEPSRDGWHISWRFGQRIAAETRSPMAFYVLTLSALLLSIFGLQYAPDHPFHVAQAWIETHGSWKGLLLLLACSSLIQTVRFIVCGVQLLLLTSKAYNVSLRLSPWGLHLHVGDEANDLFENRLYTSMFHVSQVLVCWAVILLGAHFFSEEWLQPMVLVSALLTFWELNPFKNSEGRKLVRALLIPSDRDVVSWHFEANTLINSINPEARRRDQDFARICAVWGAFWLLFSFFLLHRAASVFGPAVLGRIMHPSWDAAVPMIGMAAWMAALYYVVQSLVETIFVAVIRPYWAALYSRMKRLALKPQKSWETADVLKQIETLPLFEHFHEQYLEKLAANSKVLTFDSGDVIMREYDPAREIFVLLDGLIEVVRSGQGPRTEDWVTELGAVSVFGEAALVDDLPRTSQAVAKTPATVLRVPIYLIRQVALEAQSVRQLEVFRNAIMVNQFFASSPVFRSLSTASIEYLCSRGTLEYFDSAQDVFRQGDSGDSLFLILRGTVEVEVHAKIIKRLHQGSFFGEIALIANIPRTATVRATEPSVFFKISSDAFWEVLVQHMDLGVFIETVSETRLKEDLALAAPLKPTGSDS